MNETIKQFVQAKRVAVLGASRSGTKFGNTIASELKQRGYQVFLVHPQAQEIQGEKCYPDLASVRDLAESVLICLPPAATREVLRDVAAAGFERVWLQMGANSAETEQAAREAGLNPVTGKCILMYAEPVGSFHAWHKAFARLFGQY